MLGLGCFMDFLHIDWLESSFVKSKQTQNQHVCVIKLMDAFTCDELSMCNVLQILATVAAILLMCSQKMTKCTSNNQHTNVESGLLLLIYFTLLCFTKTSTAGVRCTSEIHAISMYLNFVVISRILRCLY